MTNKLFDLNIEEVLENWLVEHALREIIANALDEQFITETRSIEIYKDKANIWHIRDYGRGIKIEHFTLNENEEKLAYSTGVIGKFGVGLKDALATLYRNNIKVNIMSRYGTFRLKQESKHDFNDIMTLHIEYNDTINNMQGTDFLLANLNDSDIVKAKSLFLNFRGQKPIDSNFYGEIIEKKQETPCVYIQGVFANEEPNFLFSYNITNLTDSIRKKLNRERQNVSRSLYADRIKQILLNSQSEVVNSQLVDQIYKRSQGTQCDEMSWIDVSQKAINILNQRRKVVYFTENELRTKTDISDLAQTEGNEIIVISETQRNRLDKQVQSGGPEVRTVDKFVGEYNESFNYEFVNINDLSNRERRIYKRNDFIASLVGIPKRKIPKILISKSIRVTDDDTGGVWDVTMQAIVIKREQLRSIEDYAGTLLHELAHATTGTADVSRSFERVLTKYLGLLVAKFRIR